jgi:hypothetical protein
MSDIVAVEHDYSVDDAVAYSLHLMRTRAPYRRQRFLVRIAAPVVLVIIGIFWISINQSRYPHAELWPFAFYFAFVVVYTLYVWLWYWQASKRRLIAIFSQGRNRMLFGKTRIELRRDVIWRAQAMSEGWVRWAAVENVERDADYAYITVGTATAYVVPRQAFGDEASFDRFVARAAELWQQAQTT